MRIQRILQAKVEEVDGGRWVVLAYTSRKEFVTWCYNAENKYDGGHYFSNFLDAFTDFQKRADSYYTNYVIEYCARQIGQAEIVWEVLCNQAVTGEAEVEEAKKEWDEETNQAGRRFRKARIASEKQEAKAKLEKASKMSKAEFFLRELQATDTDDYNVLRDRVAALMEELGLESEHLTIWRIHRLCAEIDIDVAKRHGDGSHQSWDGYTIPAECKGKECGKCELDSAGRITIGCTVPIGEEIKTEIATKEYECGCGATVKPGTELHLCRNCGTKQCPNCYDYRCSLCEECLSG